MTLEGDEAHSDLHGGNSRRFFCSIIYDTLFYLHSDEIITLSSSEQGLTALSFISVFVLKSYFISSFRSDSVFMT